MNYKITSRNGDTLYYYLYDPSSKRKLEASSKIKLQFPHTIRGTADSVHPKEPHFGKIQALCKRIQLAINLGLDIDNARQYIDDNDNAHVETIGSVLEHALLLREEEYKEDAISYSAISKARSTTWRYQEFEEQHGVTLLNSILFTNDNDHNAKAVAIMEQLYGDFYNFYRKTRGVSHNTAVAKTKWIDMMLRLYCKRMGGSFFAYTTTQDNIRPVVALSKSVCIDLYNKFDDAELIYLDHCRPEEIEAYAYAHRLMVFGIFTCLRKVDVLTLNVDDFRDMDGRMWMIKTSQKTRSVQKTMLPEKLATWVRDTMDRKQHSILHYNNQPVAGNRTYWAYGKDITYYMRQIITLYPEANKTFVFEEREKNRVFSRSIKKLKDVFRVHDLRATGITMHLANGMSERNVKNISGHKAKSVAFERYVAYVKEYHQAEIENSFSNLGIR
jgi:integrase